MRAARKCDPTRRAHSTRYLTVQLRRPLRNALQNRPELLVSLMAAVVAEGEFVEIALQILLADPVVRSVDAPFEQAPESFDGVGVDFSDGVDTALVPDSAVPVVCGFSILRPHHGDSLIAFQFVGVDDAAGFHMLPHKSEHGGPGDVRHDPRNDLSATFDESNDGSLFPVSAHRAASPVLPHAAIIGFVHLDRRTLQFQIAVRHEHANLFEHAPRGFVSHSGFPLNLFCGDTAASGPHEERGIKPEPQRSARLLKDGPGQRVNLTTAVSASVGGAASHTMVLPLNAALSTGSNAAGESPLLDKFQAGIIVRKFRVEIPNGVAEGFRDALFHFHLGGSSQHLNAYQKPYLLSRDNYLSGL